MWLLPRKLEPCRVHLPAGLHLLPWYFNDDEAKRTGALLHQLLPEVDYHVVLRLERMPFLTHATPASLERSLLTVLVGPDMEHSAVEGVLERLPARFLLVRLPQSLNQGYGWLERHLKPALLAALARTVHDTDHPLAPSGLRHLPMGLAAELSPDPVEILDLLGAALADRLLHAEKGVSEEDYRRSLFICAGRRLAERLLRLPHQEIPAALEMLVECDVAPARLRAGSESLQRVGLARVVAGDTALGPLGRRLTERPVAAGLIEALPQEHWSLVARDRLAARTGDTASNPGIGQVSAVGVSSASGLQSQRLMDLVQRCTIPGGVDDTVDMLAALHGVPDGALHLPTEVGARLAIMLRGLDLQRRALQGEQRALLTLVVALLRLMAARGAGVVAACRRAYGELQEAAGRVGEAHAAIATELAWLSRHRLIFWMVYRGTDDGDEVDALIAQALRELPEGWLHAHTLEARAALSLRRGDIVCAWQDYEEASRSAAAAGDAGTAARCQNQILWIEAESGNFQVAQERALRARSRAQQAGDPNLLASSESTLASITFLAGRYDEAEENLRHARDLYDEEGQRDLAAICERSLAAVFLARGEATRAIDAANRALQVLAVLGDEAGVALSNAVLAGAWWQMGALDTAWDHFERAREAQERLGLRGDLAETLTNLARLDQDRGDAAGAALHAVRAFVIYHALDRAPPEHLIQTLRDTRSATVPGFFEMFTTHFDPAAARALNDHLGPPSA